MKKLLIISTYPEQGETHSAKTVGGASYTKTLVEAIAAQTTGDLEMTVWAEYFQKPEKYQEGKIQIERVWQRSNLAVLTRLCQNLLRTKHSTILLSLEGYMFGSVFALLPLLVTLWFAKLFQKKQVVILVHQVVTNVADAETNPVRKLLYPLLLKPFYTLVKMSSNTVVVFEEYLRKMLGGSHVVTLPHAVFSAKKMDKTTAREKLGLDPKKPVALYFGYLAPYKGVDWLVQNWPDDSKTQLVLAGDMNPNHRDNPDMKQFVDGVKKQAKQKGTVLAGFIPEDQISTYFSAADVLILPYKTMMSSSGPLAMAIAYDMPFLLSKPLEHYVDSLDFTQAIRASGLEKEDIVFDFSPGSLTQKIDTVVRKPQAFQQFFTEMKQSRSLEKVAQMYKGVLLK